ncbi:hypothetical protein B0181_04835 [Moraxella caviae]|uniref:Uncharacterized protein n=1 Tax=Moraxella caviae TaxID=34060 RepID=A0A1T0A3A7_9GAMM|nr:hypothetical protein [Moraxella caviae]OOR90204.1 hypothetical protein B0181_04835 [Moraxella caviae]STZ14578.1 Uncharacterised protein [Moraxella caviae]VEW12583.1 Uncharacterised protein [Moraxella caviae]
MKSIFRNLQAFVIIALSFFVIAQAHATNNSKEYSRNYIYSDFLETLDDDTKFVGKRMVHFTQGIHTTRPLSAVELQTDSLYGVAVGRYKGRVHMTGNVDKDKPYYSDTKTLVKINATQRALITKTTTTGLKPSAGAELFAEFQSGNHRVEVAADAVIGLAYKGEDFTVGAQYNHTIKRNFWYKGKHAGRLEQNDGKGITVFGEKHSNNKTHGVSLSYRESPKGDIFEGTRDDGVRYTSYEPKHREYKLAYYVKF